MVPWYLREDPDSVCVVHWGIYNVLLLGVLGCGFVVYGMVVVGNN